MREREKPRFAVWRRSMNLLKQVEPLKQAALQASSLQRHAHHAASRLTWVNIGSTSLPPSRTKQGTQTLGAILVLARGAVKICHSMRIAAMGSTRAARRAGR